MRFSDSTQFNIPKPFKCANSESSPFNSDESLSDEDSPQRPITPSTASNYNFTTPFSNDSSPIKKITKTPQTDIPFDILRHPTQDQPNLLPPPINRTTKTHYNLRHQPKIDYRTTNHTLYWLNEN